MGGAIDTGQSSGGKRALDVNFNLVPFIDLLSCCISFLLITAVWTQLARMDVQQKGQGAAGSTDEKPPENQVNLTLFVDKDGYIFQKSTGESTTIPLKENEYDYAKLGEVLAKTKSELPDKTDINVKAADDVIYEKLIHTLDTAISCGKPKGADKCFPDVGLSDKGQGG